MSDDMNELDLMVGSMFTVLPAEDREAFEEEQAYLADIQELLREEGVEVDLLSRPGAQVWDGGVKDFADLYNLRLMAAYLEQGKDIAPILANGDVGEEPDPLLAKIWEGDETTRYSNLINHQAEGGYYLPVDFAEPIWIEWETEEGDGESDEDSGDSVVSFGSSIGLQRELTELEQKLTEAGVPARHGAMSCLKVLRQAADASVSNDLPIIVW